MLTSSRQYPIVVCWQLNALSEGRATEGQYTFVNKTRLIAFSHRYVFSITTALANVFWKTEMETSEKKSKYPETCSVCTEPNKTAYPLQLCPPCGYPTCEDCLDKCEICEERNCYNCLALCQDCLFYLCEECLDDHDCRSDYTDTESIGHEADIDTD